MSSSTRGLWAAGRSPTNQDTIDYVEIATLGNALDFGDTTVARQWLAGCSSSTRGIIAGGENNPFFPSPGRTSRIEFITMASKGDAILFGDLTEDRQSRRLLQFNKRIFWWWRTTNIF